MCQLSSNDDIDLRAAYKQTRRDQDENIRVRRSIKLCCAQENSSRVAEGKKQSSSTGFTEHFVSLRRDIYFKGRWKMGETCSRDRRGVRYKNKIVVACLKWE